jgi:DNA-binding response OmpR family regulator
MPSNQRQNEPKTEKKPNILVIDDEESILNLISDILTAEGYRVVCVENGEKGVECAQKEEFDLIIVDIMMPGIDGIETIRRIRQFNTVVNVLILTAYGKRKDAVVNAVKYGVFDYITKPFDVDYLTSLIKYVLHRAKFGRMPYLDTMRDFYWEREVSQADLVQKKWSDLKQQVESSARVIEQDKKRIERSYVQIAPRIEALKYYFKSTFMNRYTLVILMCLMLGGLFGYLFNLASTSQSSYESYISGLKVKEYAASQRAKDSEKVTLTDFYNVMKNIEQWMKKDVEQEGRAMRIEMRDKGEE